MGEKGILGQPPRVRTRFATGTSGIFPVTDGDYLTIEIFEEFRQFFFSALYHIGNLHVIQCTNYRSASDTLDKTKLLPCFGRDMNSLEFVVFT